MSLFNKVITKVFGKKSDKDLKKISPIIEDINKEFETLNHLTDQEIKDRFNKIKADLSDLVEKKNIELKENSKNSSDVEKNIIQLEKDFLDENMVKVFAIVKDVSRRLAGTNFKVMETEMTWNMVHYDVQLIGGIVLHQGKISEMKTGEGKTLVSTLPIVLNAITNRGVHVVTVNDYLAQRDSEWMGLLYNFLGLSVGCLLDRMPPNLRKEAYEMDITYGTNSQFGFDYLRDNMVSSIEQKVQRNHYYAIVDEVDSVLVDEARTPLIISGSVDAPINPEYSTWRNKIESLVRTQNKMVNDLVIECEELLMTDKATAGIKLLIASKGAPKNKKLMNLYQETGIKRLVHDTESEYIREKKISEIEEQLYFVIDENSRVTDLSEMGRQYLSSTNPEFFVIPDLGDVYYEIEKTKGITNQEILKKKQDAQQLHGERSERIHIINKLLQAFCLYEKDIEYIVQNGKVQIVDEHTGRVLHGRRYSDGLHEAIEIKENVVVGRESQTHATITIQNYFRMYDKLSGMTGTAETEAAEFEKIYNLGVTVIPTHKTVIRQDFNDVIYKSMQAKYKAVVKEVNEFYKKGQPVLIGTVSVDVSELLSKMLKQKGIPHNVLNAKQHKSEAEIVAQAGLKKSITIATNMAGRGTDIKLGPGVEEMGGLHIIGTARHESRRIDLQLMGRSGRQGDSGSSRFYISLEDDLMRLFNMERLATYMDRLSMDEDQELSAGMLNRGVSNAQRKVEERNFAMRKHLLEYDDVLNQQREIIYDLRNKALLSESIKDTINEFIEDFIYDNIGELDFKNIKDWDWANLNQRFNAHLFVNIDTKDIEKFKNIEDLEKYIFDKAIDYYKVKEEVIPSELLRKVEKFIVLKTIDEKWRNHLLGMDQLREGIGLRAYGQKNPLIEYKSEAYNFFQELMISLRSAVLQRVFHAQISDQNQTRQNPLQKNLEMKREDINPIEKKSVKQDIQMKEQNTDNTKIGRNEKVELISPSGEKISVKYKKIEQYLMKGYQRAN